MKGQVWSIDNAFIDTTIWDGKDIAVLLDNDETRSLNSPFFYLAVARDGQWLTGGDGNWNGLALATANYPLAQVLVIGPQGQVHITGSGDRHTETIIDEGFSPATLGLLRGAQTIDGLPFVCGMKKQVYKRVDAHRWECISKEIAGGAGVHGFEAIDGFSQTNIYAVGWNGEIWHYDGSSWHKKNSPSSSILTDVCCAGNGAVYVLDREQHLITGMGDTWKKEKTGLPVDLVSICWFQDRLYAASTRDIFVLNDSSVFEPIVIPGDYPATCGKLMQSGGLMASAGERDLFSFDGTNWTRID